MTTTTAARQSARGHRVDRFAIYRTEAHHEFLKLIRIPIFAVSVVALPVMFYVIFGVTFADGTAGGVGATTYMLATYGAFGVIGAALFGFGVSVAMERGQGWMRLKRVSPMPPLAYFVAKVVMAAAVAAIIVVLLFVLGATVGDVSMTLAHWVSLGSVLVLGALPFSAMGLAFGYLVGPNSGPGRAQPHLAADGLRLRALDPDLATTADRPGGRELPAAVTFAQLALGTIGASEGGSPVIHRPRS